jgi:hypothetical protein
MTENEIRRRFPNASESTIRRNQAGGEVSHSKQCQRTEALEINNVGEAQGSSCVPVCFTLYRIRLLDVDAKYSSVKDLLDCLVNSGFLAGDKEGQVTLEVRQVKVKTRAGERTEIEIL